MTPDEARHLIIEGINYATYRETDSSLYDADKNRLFGSDHYNSGRLVAKPSPWTEGEFEEKMATLLRWANSLNRSVPAFKEAQSLLESEDSVIGRVPGDDPFCVCAESGHADFIVTLNPKDFPQSRLAAHVIRPGERIPTTARRKKRS